MWPKLWSTVGVFIPSLNGQLFTHILPLDQLGTQVFGIGGDRMQSGGHGLEEQVVDYRFILQGQPGDRFRQGEDDVEVDDRQQLLLAGGNPAGFGQGLALGAMAVATGNGELSITCLMVSGS